MVDKGKKALRALGILKLLEVVTEALQRIILRKKYVKQPDRLEEMQHGINIQLIVDEKKQTFKSLTKT